MNFFMAHLQVSLTLKYHVLFVMFLVELELPWFLLKLHVLHPGPENTMATSQLHLTLIIDHHTPTLMLIQRKLLELPTTQMVHSSIMLA